MAGPDDLSIPMLPKHSHRPHVCATETATSDTLAFLKPF